MTESAQPEQPRIADRLRGRHLLVTGVTGLLAKVFIEKLLRSVPEVGRIHLLVRPGPNGASSADRLEREVLGSPVFSRLGALLGPALDALWAEKVQVVSGDLTKDRLGLSDEAYEALAGEVDIIVNSAAAVSFDERLDLALAMNTLGPGRLLTLARDCGNAPLLQVSTCYTSGRRTGDIPETLLGPSDGSTLDLDEVIEEVQRICDGLVSEPDRNGGSRRRSLVEAGLEIANRYGWFDTYTFTKWLGEQLVNRDRGDVPVVILRPAIIESSFEEPFPGWIDGLRMADPMIIAFGRGKLPEFPANPDVASDIIPVDLVSNAMVAAMPMPDDGPGLRVYHVGTSHRHPLRLSDLLDWLGESFRNCPMLDDAGNAIHAGEFKAVPREVFVRKWKQRLDEAVRERDRLAAEDAPMAERRKARSAVAQIEQFLYLDRIYSPYTCLDCRFLDHNLRALIESMHPHDRVTFPFAAEAIDWKDYAINRHVPGLRKYVLGGTGGDRHPAPVHTEVAPDDRRIRASMAKAATVYEAFEGVASLCEHKIALQINRSGRWIRYTFGEALAATVSIARRFAELGLTPGDRVVIWSENCPEWGLTYFAAMRAGLTAVPLDPQMPVADVLGCARFAEAKAIIAGATTFDTIAAECPGFGITARGIAAACSDAEPEAAFDGPIVRMTEPFVPPPGASRDPGPAPVAVSGEQIASILFTSGTTVAPKAVPLTHNNFLANVRSIIELQSLRSEENYLSVLPLYHAFEFTAGLLTALFTGATITYVEHLKGPEIVATMQSTGTTAMLVVPRLLKLFHDSIQRKVDEAGSVARTAFRAMGRLSDFSGGRLGRALFGKVHRGFGGRLRKFYCGGSALDPALHVAFSRMGFIVCEGYGLTETGPILTGSPSDGGKPGSVGPAVPGVELDIRNANPNGIGEVWARGPNVMKGYLKNEEATAEAIQDGWFRTGDLGRRDAKGYFYLTGRVKDMIITDAGKNVYPDEVELRYRALPHVKELCVLGMPNSGGVGDAVHAVIVPDLENANGANRAAIEEEIRGAVSQVSAAIPSHQQLGTVHFWRTELPKTTTMKAKRSVIRSRLLVGDATGTLGDRAASKPAQELAPVDPGSLTEGQSFVRTLLARLTHKSESVLRPDCNLLLDLGVDSLMKLQVVSELETHFDLKCTDEQAAAVTRLSDLYALIENLPLLHGRARPGDAWRKRLRGSQRPGRPRETVSSNGDNGQLFDPLLPARWTARGGMSLFFRSYVRVRAKGVRNLPTKGSFILAANHNSHLDSAAVLTAVAGRRRIWVASAQDYFFSTRLRGWVFESLFDMIPVDRHAEGLNGLRRCLAVLEHGDGVLFFPEGTRSMTGRMQPFKIGAAVMAVEAGVPLIPTRIDHTFDLMRKGRRLIKPGSVRVTFGQPVFPTQPDDEDDIDEQYRIYRELTEDTRARVAALGEGERVALAEV